MGSGLPGSQTAEVVINGDAYGIIHPRSEMGRR